MSSYKKSSGTAPLIVTITAAVAAAVAVVIMLIFADKGKNPDNGEMSQPVNSVFAATPELHGECANAAKTLVSANYEVIRLYVTEGLPPKSVYGKISEPIDGAYVIESGKYTEYSQIETLVRSIYTEAAADEVLKRTEVSDGETVKKIQVYDEHNVHGAVFLGMNTEFSVDKDYKTDWSDCYIVTAPESENKCAVTVYVNGVTADDAESHPESVLKTSMVRTPQGWRFTSFLK